MRAVTNLARGFVLLFCSSMVVDAGAQTVVLSPIGQVFRRQPSASPSWELSA